VAVGGTRDLKKEKNSPLKAYAIAGQIGLTVVTPLVVFIGGGCFLADRLNWADWTKLVFVLAGISVMISSTASYLKKLLNLYEDLKKSEPPKLDRREYDFYDDNYKKPK